jgi:hypothetical protein
MRAIRTCFILPLLLAASLVLAQKPQAAPPRQAAHPTVHKKVARRHAHRRRGKTAPPTQSVEIINGTKTQTTVFSGSPRTSTRQNASGRQRATGTKSASKSTTIEVTNGEKTQTQVFSGTRPRPAGSKAARTHSSTATGAAKSPVTVEVINGTSEQTKVFSGTPQQPAQKTAPKPPDPQTAPN